MIKSLIISVCLAVTCLTATAQTYPSMQSFQMTNGIASAAVITNGFPTNAPGTNGVCLGTGTYIGIPNYDRLLLDFKGSNSTTDVGNFVFTLVRSPESSPTLTNDFESKPSLPPFVVAMNGQNFVHWMSNLDSTAIGPISAIGLYSVSNTAAAGTITNGILRIGGKIVPIRYP